MGRRGGDTRVTSEGLKVSTSWRCRERPSQHLERVLGTQMRAEVVRGLSTQASKMPMRH